MGKRKKSRVVSTKCKWVVENTVQSLFQCVPGLIIFSLTLCSHYPLPAQIHSSAYAFSDSWVICFIPALRQPFSLGKQDDKISRPRAERNSLGEISSNPTTIDGNLSEVNYFHLSQISLSFGMESHLVEKLLSLWTSVMHLWMGCPARCPKSSGALSC